MKAPEKVEGKMGFEDKKIESQEIVSKEETMFRLDATGSPIPEKYPIRIYDRNLDNELIEESMLLMQLIKKQKAINSVMLDLVAKQNKDIQEKKSKLEKETDEKVKVALKDEIKKLEDTRDLEDIKTKINANVIDEGIKESREIIQGLKAEKDKQMVTQYVELKPCNNAESVWAFEKGKTIEGKDTTEWVNDVISKKIINPKYSLEEARNLKQDYKFALKEALMESSNYKLKNYRDIMTEKKLNENKPLTLKKELPNGG